MAYEDWSVDGDLVGPPDADLQSVRRLRGRRARPALPLSRSGSDRKTRATREARRWIRDFGRSREGRAYRPWVERFLAGRLPPSFGDDPRERWWRLDPAADEARRARAARPPGSGGRRRGVGPRVPQLHRSAVARDRPRPRRRSGRRAHQRSRARRSAAPARRGAGRARRRATASPTSCSRTGPTGASTTWSPRCRARAACAGSRAASRSGASSRDADQGTLASLGPAPAGRPARRAPSPTPRCSAARRCPRRCTRQRSARFRRSRRTWTRPSTTRAGATTPHRVSIGRGGHFITNPESLSPRYGSWIAALRFSLLARHGRARRARRDGCVPDRRVRRRQRAARARHPRRRDPRRRRPRAARDDDDGGRSRRASRTASTRRRRRCATSSSALLGQRRGRRRR